MSWHKSEFGASVSWIGYTVHVAASAWGLTEAKLAKLCDFLAGVVAGGDWQPRKAITRGTGLAQWIFRLFRHWKPWNAFLFRALKRPKPADFFLTPQQAQELFVVLMPNNRVAESMVSCRPIMKGALIAAIDDGLCCLRVQVDASGDL